MPQIEWTSDLEIGIAVIDGQHRRIVDYINTLDAIEGDGETRTVARVMDELVDYTYSHFAFEEALMEEAGYAYLSVHQGTHRAFIGRVNELKRRFDNGENVAADVAELLRTWLISHIMSDDNSYAPIVREQMPGIAQKEQGGWLSRTVQKFFGP
jgi:hemerythrin